MSKFQSQLQLNSYLEIKSLENLIERNKYEGNDYKDLEIKLELLKDKYRSQGFNTYMGLYYEI